MLKGLHTVSTN